jgi:hypothetical protein
MHITRLWERAGVRASFGAPPRDALILAFSPPHPQAGTRHPEKGPDRLRSA